MTCNHSPTVRVFAATEGRCPLCLAAENAELKRQLTRDPDATICRLEAENVALRKDAARYRWLRDSDTMGFGIFIIVLTNEVGGILSPAETDAYVDAAMGEKP